MVGGRDQAKSTDEPRVRDIIPDFVVIARRHGRRVTLFIIPRDKHICASLLCRAGSTPTTAGLRPVHFLDERISPSTSPLFNAQLADASPMLLTHIQDVLKMVASICR